MKRARDNRPLAYHPLLSAFLCSASRNLAEACGSFVLLVRNIVVSCSSLKRKFQEWKCVLKYRTDAITDITPLKALPACIHISSETTLFVIGFYGECIGKRFDMLLQEF